MSTDSTGATGVGSLRKSSPSSLWSPDKAKGKLGGSGKQVEEIKTNASAGGAKQGACCAQFVKNHAAAIRVGIITFIILAAIVGAGLGLGAHYLGGIDKIPAWLKDTPITVAQGFEFIAAPILGGAILIALTAWLGPKAAAAIKRKCAEARKKTPDQPKNLTTEKEKNEEQKVNKGNRCGCTGCGKKKEPNEGTSPKTLTDNIPPRPDHIDGDSESE